MEILVVVGTLSGQDGIEPCVQSLAQEAAAHGDHVRVLALCPSTVDGSWHDGLDYSEVPNGSTSLKRQALSGLPAIVRACREQRPDVVIVIYSSTVPVARLALVLAGLKRPVMAWLHFSDALKQRTNLLRFAHGHICISKPIVESTRVLPGVRAENVHLVQNGTRMDSVRVIPRSEEGPLRIVHVGRLMLGEQKRTDDLFRALAMVSGDWRLQLVGTVVFDHDAGKLEALADELGIADRIDWLGWQDDPWAALDRADLLVLCSSYEGFPMVLIEAMARGIPCLSSDCPSGPSDIIRPGHNGWLFRVEDIPKMAARLQAVVDDRSLLPFPRTVRASVEPFSSQRAFLRIRKAIESTIDSAGDLRLHPHS